MSKAAEWDVPAELDWPERILIVDDSVVARMTLRRLFGELGVESQIIEAGDASDALTMWRAARPGLSLIDVNMPGDDGLSLSEQIRALDPDAPIIICTSNVQKVVDARAAQLRLRLLKKPITIDTLEAAARDAVGQV